MELFDFKIFTSDPKDIFMHDKKQFIVNTLNPHSFVLSRNDPQFYKALKASDVLLPDGIGIIIASYIINRKKIDKITGPLLLDIALNHLNKKNAKVFFLGASEKTLVAIKEKLNKRYNNIKVDTFSPSFTDKFSESENRKILNKINEFNPDLLCVGMTAPKQEKWVYVNKGRLPDCYIMSVGAAFDWFSGIKKKPSKLSRAFHLVWLERFFREPIRMMPRMKSMILFIIIVFSFKINKILN